MGRQVWCVNVLVLLPECGVTILLLLIPFYWRVRNRQCALDCDKCLTIEHILLTCLDFIEIRESHFTAKSLRMLFQDISPEKIFYFLKEFNIFLGGVGGGELR